MSILNTNNLILLGNITIENLNPKNVNSKSSATSTTNIRANLPIVHFYNYLENENIQKHWRGYPFECKQSMKKDEKLINII